MDDSGDAARARHEAGTIGIVGCGQMGAGIAQIAAQAGFRVVLHDSRDGAARAACAALAETWARLVARGRMDAAAATAAGTRLQAADTLAALAGCEVVIEAIVEQLDAKRALFAQLEAILSADAILATNTSSLSVTAIAAGLARPERVAGFHFFNPVPLMKIVEVIAGVLTAPAVADRLLELGRAWGHTAVRAKDTPGFIVNHAGRGFVTEGLRLEAENVAPIHVIDRVLRDCAGFRLGPFELLDLTGLDVSTPVMESIYHQYYEDPRYRPQPLARTMLAAGLFGRKAGRGFYAYGEDAARPADARWDGPPARTVWISPVRPELARRAAEIVHACGGTVSSAEQPQADALILVTPLGEDSTHCAVEQGLDARRTVAIDLVFDGAERRLLMGNPALAPEWAAAAGALFAADGTAVDLVRDSAGMIAQRVVAHIVNIACEIAQQGIAAPADIDRAVTLGLGYPHGPLAWGDRIGAARVLEILDTLQGLTGDPRYRPSTWLRRRARLGLSLLASEA